MKIKSIFINTALFKNFAVELLISFQFMQEKFEADN